MSRNHRRMLKSQAFKDQVHFGKQIPYEEVSETPLMVLFRNKNQLNQKQRKKQNEHPRN